MLSSVTQAASDGSIGGLSSANSSVNVVMPKLIRARNFNDFTATYAGTGNIDRNDNLNISVNYGVSAATRQYRVVATGSGAGGTFRITNGLANINYNVWYNDVIGTGGRVAMTANTALINQTAAVKPLSNATLNANLSIRFTQANLQARDAGVYTGTLTLVFTPQ